MNALLFVIRKNLKNIVKSTFRKPLALIGYIIVILFIISIIVYSFAMPSGIVRASSPELFRGIMILVFAFFYYTSLKLGIEKGSSYFRMADVNLAFTAPLKPNQILLYGFINQLGGILILVFIALCQMPNLKNNFIMEPYGAAVLILAVVAYTLSYPLISMIIYSWTSVKKERKVLVKRIFDGAAILVALIFVMDLARTRNFSKSLIDVFGSPVAVYFPVIGWTGSIASSAVEGFDTAFYVGTAGMLTLITGLSMLLYNMNHDYYEDVLEATEYAEQVIKAKREGKNAYVIQKTRKNVHGSVSGQGARALFSKSMLEQRKASFVLFFDRMSVSVVLTAIILKLVMPSETKDFSLLTVLCISVYMLLLIQSQARWAEELEKPFVFLIPASPYQKLFYATLADHLKNMLDGALLFILCGIFFREDAMSVVMSILSYTAFGAVFIYAEVLTRRIFGNIHSRRLMLFVKIIFSLVLLLPGIIAAAIVGALIGTQFMIIGALGAWAFILAVTLFIFSGAIFNNIEASS
jgi:hypothetical protein